MERGRVLNEMTRFAGFLDLSQKISTGMAFSRARANLSLVQGRDVLMGAGLGGHFIQKLG